MRPWTALEVALIVLAPVATAFIAMLLTYIF